MSVDIQPGYGEMLRTGREAKGLSHAGVADKLKLTVRQIEALEQEDASVLPGPVFVRGFIRNYARLVDIPPEQLIGAVDAQATVSETIIAPSEGVILSSNGLRRWVVLPLAVMGVFVLLVALLYHWLRQGEDALIIPAAQPASAVVQPQLPAPVSAAVVAPLVVTPADPQASGDNAPISPMPSPPKPSESIQLLPAPTPQIPTAAPAPVRPTPPATVTAPPPAPAPSHLPATSPSAVAALPSVPQPASSLARNNGRAVQFEVSQDAWIQVVDGKGKRYSRLVPAGSVDVFKGDPPFKLIVGEASQVRVTYDGRPVDLTPFIGHRVARLSLE